VLYYQFHHWVFHAASMMPDELDRLGFSQRLGNVAAIRQYIVEH
jgi:hypothetical protein